MNEWEKLATAYFPEHICPNAYSNLAMEIVALENYGIFDRFSSMPAMCEWLSALLGWPVDSHQLRRAITRFKARPNSKPEPERYLLLLDFYREPARLFHENKLKLLKS